jgi:allantoinase
MKARGDGSFLDAWGGIASLQLALRVVWTDAHRRGLSMPRVARWMSEQPAKMAGLEKKGAIREGNDADLVIFDSDGKFQVDGARLEHRHPLTPYAGETLSGVVEMTFVRGEKVYVRGEFGSERKGMQCFRA